MKDLTDYPINFPYGATTAPYSPAKPHHGEDRAAPVGTPIIVNGTKIGEVGSTGFSSGPHCHIDKNKVYPATSGYVNPRGWSLITGSVVFAGDAGTAGKMVVVKATNGYYYRFLHMSKITATKGLEVGMYKGQTAKHWYEEAQRYKGYTVTWRTRYQGLWDKIKTTLGVRL